MFFQKKWALVLSGGGAKGLAHIGVLKYLDEIGIRPDMIVGTSAGAMVGGFYACGMSGKQIEEFMMFDFEYKNYFDIKSIHLPNMSVTKALLIGESLKNLFSNLGVDSGTKIHKKIMELTRNKDFGEEQIPFFCNSVDLVSHRHIIHHEGKIADAIRASISIPGFFAPFQMNDMFLVDGGVFDNMPVFIPRENGIKNVVAVNLNNYMPEKIEKFVTGMDVIVDALFINSRITPRIGDHLPDIEIIAYDGRSSSNINNPENTINFGYEKTKEKSDEIKKIAMSSIKDFLQTEIF